MGQIDREGTFRGHVVETGLSYTSKAKALQWVARFQAIEMYDENSEQWVDWSEYDEREAIGYFTLCDKDNKPLKFQAENINRALGWGGDISELQSGDFSETIVQFRVQENTYDGKTNLKVTRIDHANADPTRSLQKMDDKELKSVSAKFSKAFQNVLGGPKPKPVGKPKAPKTDPSPQSTTENETTGIGSTTISSAKKKRGRPPKRKAEEPKVEEPKKGELVGVEILGLPEKVTDEAEAWNQVEKYIIDGVLEDELAATWQKAVENLGGYDALDESGEWARVRDITLETHGFKQAA